MKWVILEGISLKAMHQSFTILYKWIQQKSLLSAALIFIFWVKNCFCTVTRKLVPKFIYCSFHIAIYYITWIWNHSFFYLIWDLQVGQAFRDCGDMTWKCGIYTHMCMKGVWLKKKGWGIDGWYDTSLIDTCVIVLCFRFQCVLSRSSQNWNLLRKPKVWPLFSKLEGRKCSNRGKMTRSPKILSIQFGNATCFTTFHSFYWKHKHPFELLLVGGNQPMLLFENQWKHNKNLKKKNPFPVLLMLAFALVESALTQLSQIHFCRY